jgi:hypothetical protein
VPYFLTVLNAYRLDFPIMSTKKARCCQHTIPYRTRSARICTGCLHRCPKYTILNHPVEGIGLSCPLALVEIMSQSQFVKATNNIDMQDKWTTDEDWIHHIQKQEGLKIVMFLI